MNHLIQAERKPTEQNPCGCCGQREGKGKTRENVFAVFLLLRMVSWGEISLQIMKRKYDPCMVIVILPIPLYKWFIQNVKNIIFNRKGVGCRVGLEDRLHSCCVIYPRPRMGFRERFSKLYFLKTNIFHNTFIFFVNSCCSDPLSLIQ